LRSRADGRGLGAASSRVPRRTGRAAWRRRPGSTNDLFVGFVYVGLRSQSLADPTLGYSALSGRRAGYPRPTADLNRHSRFDKSFRPAVSQGSASKPPEPQGGAARLDDHAKTRPRDAIDHRPWRRYRSHHASTKPKNDAKTITILEAKKQNQRRHPDKSAKRHKHTALRPDRAL